ncbi:DNA-binding protein [Candidatus Avelusimicrobium fimicolum]|uniref:helix-turn-helix domain-containing transcriptional regulator n=1 Tax=Candidatus Avelusimicrobium TaxID=2840538 RepID=UPI003D096A3B
MKTTDIKVGYLTEDQADELIKYTAEDAREFVRLAVKDFKKDGNRELFFRSILQAVKWIGVSKVARKTGLSRVCIYDTLDGTNTNPSLDTLSRLLGVFGVRISFEMATEKTSRHAHNAATSYAGL